VFLESADFPFTKQLEDNWLTIKRELLALPSTAWKYWPERMLYDAGWTVFGFYFFGRRIPDNCAACPETVKVLETVPGMVTAGFSNMAPGTHIKPHRGYTNAVLRCHLGLIVPPDCALRVGAETRNWSDGKCLVFDDTCEHEAWNRSDQPRVILLLDFRKNLASSPLEQRMA